MKRLTIKEQEELLLAVGALLVNSEDPTKVTTNTAMCGRFELQNVHRVWKKYFNKMHSKRRKPQGGGKKKPISIRLHKTLIADLKKVANSKGCPLSDAHQ